MNDYISRQAAIDALGERPAVWAGSDYEIAERNQWDSDKLAIETVPSADVRENVRGEWLSMFGHCICNICGYKSSPVMTNFCPNCGCSMKEGKDERN